MTGKECPEGSTAADMPHLSCEPARTIDGHDQDLDVYDDTNQ